MKTLGQLYSFLFTFFLFTLVACSTNDVPDNAQTVKKPFISFDAEGDVYEIKEGGSLRLAPTVLNNENAVYRWLFDGDTVGTEEVYNFVPESVGRYYITLEVSNEVFVVDKEIRVDVLSKMPPAITMGIPEYGFILLVGEAKHFTPHVANDEDAAFEWSINDNPVAKTRDFTFSSEVEGDFSAVFRVMNDDGSDEVVFGISVRKPEEMPFSWEWEKDEYETLLGRPSVLSPLSVCNAFDAIYTWHVGEEPVQSSASPEYSFSPETVGVYRLTVSMQNEYTSASKQLLVTVINNEEDNFREITAQSRPQADKVWEFLAAPGQFVNEGYTAKTMEEACAYAEERLEQEAYLSLGAFGGYLVVGFDHSIVNDGSYNIRILGNSFDGSSEPGIVWVMQDENGDGKPTDTWYELKGSETGKKGTVPNYAVTYYRPSGPRMAVAWTDNLGNEGTVDYLGSFHNQECYYPAWVAESSYTLRGTRLESRTADLSGNGSYWYHGNFDWGYADNFSHVDRLTDDENHDAGINANHFRISDAIDRNGDRVELKYIDFVKIQTGVQSKAGWLGENSTEVFGVLDYNMLK